METQAVEGDRRFFIEKWRAMPHTNQKSRHYSLRQVWNSFKPNVFILNIQGKLLHQWQAMSAEQSDLLKFPAAKHTFNDIISLKIVFAQSIVGIKRGSMRLGWEKIAQRHQKSKLPSKVRPRKQLKMNNITAVVAQSSASAPSTSLWWCTSGKEPEFPEPFERYLREATDNYFQRSKLFFIAKQEVDAHLLNPQKRMCCHSDQMLSKMTTKKTADPLKLTRECYGVSQTTWCDIYVKIHPQCKGYLCFFPSFSLTSSSRYEAKS